MIKVRKIEFRDVPFVQKYASEPIIGKTSNVPSPYPKDGAFQWYQNVEASIESGTSKVYAIEYQGEFAGIISLNQICMRESRANVDYWVRADLHGRGIASGAVNETLELARSIGIVNYYSGCLARNLGSKKVLLNNGFTIDKTITLTDGKFEGEELILLSKVRT